MKIDANAPAQPVSRRFNENYMDVGGYARTRAVQVLAGGLTIRAELAARAMQGILASGMYGSMHEVVAELAIQCADALIAELNKTASNEGEEA